MFKVGQKVVCVDASPTTSGLRCALTEGFVYTVSGIEDFELQGVGGIYVAEATGIDDAFHHPAFRITRFRPAVERKTSIEIFTKMLTPKRQNAKA